MTKRIMVTLLIAFASAGPALAQAPAEDLSAPVQVWIEPSSAPAATCAPTGCGCNQDGRCWFTADGLVGFVQRSPLPPLVTTSPAGTAQASAGVLGANGTSILFGGSTVNQDERAGFRLGAGNWFDNEHTCGVIVGFSMLESQATVFAGSSPMILARPYVDATTKAPQAVLISFPGSSTGSVQAEASSGNFYEAHLDLTGNIIDQGWYRVDGLLGYRFFRYDDGVRIRQAVNPTGSTFAPGTQIVSEDDFSAENQFHGGDIGLKAEFWWDTLSLQLLAEAGLGNVHHRIDIDGSQTVTSPTTNPIVNEGGVYALTSNIGKHGSSDWTAMSEIGATLGWQYNKHIRFEIGYSLLLLSDIALAADQINTTINTSLLPPAQTTTGPNEPSFQLNKTEMWIQTLNLGVEISF